MALRAYIWLFVLFCLFLIILFEHIFQNTMRSISQNSSIAILQCVMSLKVEFCGCSFVNRKAGSYLVKTGISALIYFIALEKRPSFGEPFFFFSQDILQRGYLHLNLCFKYRSHLQVAECVCNWLSSNSKHIFGHYLDVGFGTTAFKVPLVQLNCLTEASLF